MAREARLAAAAAGEGWLAAWRGLRDNPLARAVPWGLGRSDSMLLPPMVWAVWAVCTATATVLIFQSYRHLQLNSASATMSRAYAQDALLWGVVTLLDYTLPVLLCWLLVRLYRAYRVLSGFLAPWPGRTPRLTPELAASPLSAADVVLGAGWYALAQARVSLLLLALFSAADQLAGACAAHGDVLFAPGTAAWPGAPWLWAVLGAVLIAVVKVLGGALASVAGAWLLLSFSGLWRHAFQAGLALSLALGWLLLGVVLGWPGRNPFWFTGADGVGLVFNGPLPVIMLSLGLLLLALEAQLWAGPRARLALERWRLGRVRLLLACLLLVTLLLNVGACIDYDALYRELNNANASLVELRVVAPIYAWPLQAASVSCPLAALADGFSQPGASAAGLLQSIAGRGALLIGLPLLLCAIFGGHARTAVWLARRGAP